MELLEGNLTINEIASKYDILPKSIQQWGKQFFSKCLIGIRIMNAVDEIYTDQPYYFNVISHLT